MIRLENVTLGYGEGTVILQDINFHLRPGSFHFLTGPSGSGKTTLMRLMFLSIEPTDGKIKIFDREVKRIRATARARLRRRIGIVFQDFRLLDHLTTWQNVALPLRVNGEKVSRYKADVTDMLTWVGLGNRMHQYPPFLSGGEKQRAAIARAVIHQPELLLADEPTGSVDPKMAHRLLRLFVELNRFGTSVVIATHDHQLIQHYQDMCEHKAPRLELHEGHVHIV
ncbi:MAG: ATP-binding cassette domain-containing protein [Hyphomicrobiaceae bacterium]|nr:ATP-binding cassette domain-containing protein [Hyphomicrobiaceae bacterium]